MGTPISGAVITATNVSTGERAHTATNRTGIYLLTGMSAGEYRLTVEKFGFKVSTRSNVQLHMQSQVSENIRMELGYSNETVSSRSNSWSPETAPGTKEVVNQTFPREIPLNGRSFEPLFWMVPGYVSVSTYYTSSGQSSFNGRRTTENYITVDGASVLIGTSQGTDVTLGEGAGESTPALTTLGSTNGLVSLDEIQEFTVQSNAYAPRFGHVPGAQVAILTRSGSNTWHGTVFEYFRNQSLDASDWFAGYNHLPKVAETQNDFGANFSGPFWQNRFFGFGSYEGMRLLLPQSRTEDVPTIAARNSAPDALKPVFNAFPLPNGATLSSTLAVFAATANDTANLNSGSLRIDATPTSWATFFLRGAYAPSKSTQRGAFDYYSMSTLGHTYANLTSLTLGSTVRLFGSGVYELRANYSHYKSGTYVTMDNFGGATPPALASLFSSYPTAATPENNYIAHFSTDNNGLYIGRDIDNGQRQWEISQEMQFRIHSHALSVGAGVRWLFPQNTYRGYTASYSFAGFVGAATSTTVSTRLDFSNSGLIHPIFRNSSVYLQDTWRPTHRWNITYGLRWEGDIAPRDRNGLPLRNVLNLEDPANVQLAPTTTPLWRGSSTNFAPRLGVGYQLHSTPGWETQLRVNAGIFYGLASSAASRIAQDAPYLVSHQLGTTSYPLSSSQATPSDFALTIPYSLIYAFPQDFKAPRVYEWNAGLEQHFGPHWMTSWEYVGSVGDRLLHRELLLPSEGLNPQFTSVEEVNNLADSSYNAFHFRLARSFGNGVSLWANYTLGKSIDDVSSMAHPMPYHTTYSPKLDEGSSDFDVRHSVTFIATYTSTINLGNIWVRRTFSNWSLANSFRARTSLPVNILTGSDLIPLGYTKSDYRRPDRVAGVPFYIYGNQYPGGHAINRVAFSANTAALQGNLPRNLVRGYGIWQDDLSLKKTISLRDTLHLGLRVDVFNITNHPSFGDPGSQYTTTNELTSPSFGNSSATLAQSLGHGGADGGYNPIYQIGGQRAIQLAAEVRF